MELLKAKGSDIDPMGRVSFYMIDWDRVNDRTLEEETRTLHWAVILNGEDIEQLWLEGCHEIATLRATNVQYYRHASAYPKLETLQQLHQKMKAAGVLREVA
jgi:hypothetical protein